MLIKRILSGVIFVPIVAILVWWHPISFLALVCVITTLILIEFYQLAELIGANRKTKSSVSEANIFKSLGIVLCLFFPLAAYISNRDVTLSFLTETFIYLSIVVSFVYQVVKRDTTSALLTISAFFMGIIYAGWAFGRYLVLIRDMKIDNMEIGVGLIFLFIAIIWCGDTGAYAIGRLLGRHKLIPAISPGKTIEGAMGGLFFGILGGIAIKYVFLPKVIALHHIIILGILLGIIGQIGDLGESLLKRNANMKDSGNLIPGHGGVLDRCDSMILTAPVFYYYLKYLLHIV
ncbi:phosphatidate cytidylyltransferase [bacterium]|nr:phosphatidate cytidylyltransferase [bacterium]